MKTIGKIDKTNVGALKRSIKLKTSIKAGQKKINCTKHERKEITTDLTNIMNNFILIS